MSKLLSRKSIAPLIAIGFSAILTASDLPAQPTPTEVRPWGRFEDPSGEATVEVDGETLVITSGKNSMTDQDTLGRMPRMLREVSGDFDVRVRVSASFSPKQEAVLLAFADPGEYLRMTTGLGLYPASVELSTDVVTLGELMNRGRHRPKQPSMWLRVRRVAGELSSYYSTDGKEWLFSASSKDSELQDGGRVSFTQPMQVMLLVHNQQRRTPLTVRFEHFELREGVEIQPITVVEDPAAKALRMHEEARAKRVKSIFKGFALTIVAALGWIIFFSGLRAGKAWRFSVRRLFGFVTLIGMSLGAAIFFAPSSANPDELVEFIPSLLLAVVTALAIYAACDPWLRCPAALDEERSATAGHPVHRGLAARVLAILIGVLFLLLGGFGSALLVEDNWTMDTGGASGKEWLLGLPFVASTMIGSFARGASLVGFLALFCGTPLGRNFAKHFGLCGGSFLALLLWVPAHDFGKKWAAENHGMWNACGNLASGIVGLSLLAVCCSITWWFVGRGVTFGRRARRRAGRLYLSGLVFGAVAGMIPAVEWLLFGKPPTSLFFGAMIGSSLGAILGMLTGASEGSSLQATDPFRSEPG